MTNSEARMPLEQGFPVISPLGESIFWFPLGIWVFRHSSFGVPLKLVRSATYREWHQSWYFGLRGWSGSSPTGSRILAQGNALGFIHKSGLGNFG
jgi:hypothetical protein